MLKWLIFTTLSRNLLNLYVYVGIFTSEKCKNLSFYTVWSVSENWVSWSHQTMPKNTSSKLNNQISDCIQM